MDSGPGNEAQPCGERDADGPLLLAVDVLDASLAVVLDRKASPQQLRRRLVVGCGDSRDTCVATANVGIAAAVGVVEMTNMSAKLFNAA